MKYATIKQESLQQLVDFDAARTCAKSALVQAGREGAVGLMRFFARRVRGAGLRRMKGFQSIAKHHGCAPNQ